MAQRETSWPAAASTRTPRALAGPLGTATVLGAFPSALYLLCHDGSLLPVVTPSGLRLPTAVVLASSGPPSGWGVRPGDRVEVGGTEVRLPAGTVRAVRTWVPARLPAVQAPPEAVAVVAAAASDTWRDPALELARAVPRGDDITATVAEVVGRGPGLTPSGDDVLAGVLLGLRASPALRDHLWRAVSPRLGGTTSLSAALLAEAAEGYAVPAVLRLGAALVAGGTDLGQAVREVAAVGHSSGTDLLAGLAAGLAVVAEPVPNRSGELVGALT